MIGNDCQPVGRPTPRIDDRDRSASLAWPQFDLFEFGDLRHPVTRVHCPDADQLAVATMSRRSNAQGNNTVDYSYIHRAYDH